MYESEGTTPARSHSVQLARAGPLWSRALPALSRSCTEQDGPPPPGSASSAVGRSLSLSFSLSLSHAHTHTHTHTRVSLSLSLSLSLTHTYTHRSSSASRSCHALSAADRPIHVRGNCLVTSLGGYHEGTRCSSDTYSESYTTTYTSIPEIKTSYQPTLRTGNPLCRRDRD